jgi:hypothetical protein
MRGDGRLFLRGHRWWLAFYKDGKEMRESTGTDDAKQAEKYQQRRLKELAAHELADKPFLTASDRRRTVGDLLDALQAHYAARDMASEQTLSTIRIVRRHFGDWKGLALSPRCWTISSPGSGPTATRKLPAIAGPEC